MKPICITILHPNSMAEETEEPIVSKLAPHLTKTKYRQISDEIHAVLSKEQADQVLNIICTVLQFNPLAKAYDKERINRKMRETGLSSYQLYQKKHYEENKDKYVEVNARKYRQRKTAKEAKD